MFIKKIFNSHVGFLIIISLIVLAVFGILLKGEFLNLDDINGIVNNKPLYSISESARFYDLIAITTAIVVHFFGMNPHALHATSIIVHIINCILVYILFNITFGKKVARITTLLFSVQPVTTEALGWLTAYGYLLRAVFIFSILIFYVLFRKTKKYIHLVLSVLLCAFSYGFFRSQGWMFVAPFLLVIFDQFILEKKIVWKNAWYYLPYLLISIVFAIQMLPGLFKGRVKDLNTLYYVNTNAATPLVNRIPYTTYMAFGTLAFPKNMSVYHEGEIVSGAFYGFMIFFTVLIIYGLFYFWKRDRKIAGVILIIYFSILPSFSPVIIAWTAAERYLYVGAAFFCMALTFFIMWIQEKTGWKNFLLLSVGFVFTAYSARTIVRNIAFLNSKNLWFATRITSPYSYRVYNNLGDVYASENNQEMAMLNFKRSFALKTDYADAVHNIGATYMAMGNVNLAVKYLQQSVQMNPNLYQAWWKLGYIYFQYGMFDQSLEAFNKVLQIKPGDADTMAAIAQVTATKETSPKK